MDNRLLQLYPDYGITIVKGEGAKLWDQNDKEYIDCSGGWGVANIGHSNMFVSEAVSEQARKLTVCPSVYRNPLRNELAELLTQITPSSLNQVFFVNSGTEAVEAALKFATRATGRTELIAMFRGFHGRTLGSLSVTHKRSHRVGFDHMMNSKVHFVPFNNIERIKAVISKDTAAVILEVVQGEGGVHIAEMQYLQQIREICEENGTLLIIDEVQTGFGRTGTMFAFEKYAITPDIVCLAKAIGGGLPLGAVLISDKIKKIPIGTHGSTFGGNPIAMAAGLATIKYLQESNVLSEVSEKGEYLMRSLRNILVEDRSFKEIRGIGLMIAIEFKQRIQQKVEALLESGILVIPTGKNTIRLLPPLVITWGELDCIINRFKSIINH